MLIDKSPSAANIKLDSIDTPKGVLSAWYCPQPDNPVWDAFLNSTSYGHFYQTSIWAQVRTLDGWQPLITLIRLNDQLIGGFQMLATSKAFLGKIGIVLKGPVVESDDPIILAFVINSLKRTAKKNKIRALIVQPPNKHQDLAVILKRAGFSENYVHSAIRNNTVAVDLHGSEEEVFKKIKRQKRQNINTAIKSGVVIREGNKNDLKKFFHFMCETCKRQQVSPSPDNENFLLKMWDLFSPTDHIKLFLAQHEGVDVSGLIVLPFSNIAYMWKFGWSGNCGHCRPNELLYWEIFKWAKNHGYLYADLDAISSALADTSYHSETATENLSKTYSRFKNEFGGELVSLSNGVVYIPNLIIRWAYDRLMPYINSLPSLRNRILQR
ncbi:MAG: hypothetical protein CVU51_01270 [Deltaproteobacteria bacterium HGW-Deltaproteobacteria-1]|jgi:lipid II:glycine glycyltransferase (peptidoglycan interpeptide bridge formation enzyme)|nr:MAG: hypothetical protein CVU51_01270 [Deltaproteobacteria bacterium HGW-Deltaproteobacteria-1]